MIDTFELPYVALTEAITRHATWFPEKTALVFDDQRLTWDALNRRINRVANGLLSQGLRKGDTVSLLLPPGVEMVELMLGSLKAGGVIVPLSPMVAEEGLVRMIADADARFCFASMPLAATLAPLLETVPQLRPEGCFILGADTAGTGWQDYAAWRDSAPTTEPGIRLQLTDTYNIIYSSGTTGAPKGIVHTHYARMQFANLAALEFRFDPTAVSILTTPLYSNGTWLLLLPTLAVGGTTVLMPQFDPRKFLVLVSRERGTHTFMVPPQYAAILDVPDIDRVDTSSLRVLVSTGAPLALPLKERIVTRFPGALFELYGLTEGIATSLRPEATGANLASVGTPAIGGDIRVIDDAGRESPRGEVGEIVGYGPALMRGYHKRPEETAAAIWLDELGRTYLRTGDIGRLDEAGFLYILDRKKDMIISGGFNVYPSDIEEVLVRHPAIADAAVIGIPHARWGEVPLALVALYPGATPTEEEVLTWANAQLGRHQRLAEVEFRAKIPRVPPLGKVPKRQLREPYWAAKAGG